MSNCLLAKDLFDPFQSAYRPHHSVETLLVNVSNYILQEMDHSNITAFMALLLLDLSSAFDTVNHTILLNTLRSLGVDGLAYEWFQSYLSHHSQTVCIKGTESHSMPLSCGVPQGSVGGRPFSQYIWLVWDKFCYVMVSVITSMRMISNSWFLLNQIKLMLNLLSIALKLAWMIFKLGYTPTLWSWILQSANSLFLAQKLS